ncbi:UNVERIFIED_CONTAM: hypothetical protein FKN15_049747 [Acipenser sinensis]
MQQPSNNPTTREKVKECLRTDLLAADLRCSIFVAAVQSYKRDSVLRPFPPTYINGENKEFDALLADVKSLPSVRDVLQSGPGGDEALLDLLHWVLSSKNQTLKSLLKEELIWTKIHVGMQQPSNNPTTREKVKECLRTDLLAADLRCSIFVANVQSYKRDSVLRPFPPTYINGENKEFDALLADVKSLPSVRDVLQSGPGGDEALLDLLHWVLSSKNQTLKSLLKEETSLFGEGTYLTSDLSLALLYSPHGSGWQKCILGPLLSCVAVCEIIDHPDVKCQLKNKDSDSIDRRRARVRNSEGGDVPQKYFVVTNNQLLRVKYLLVYSEKQHRRSMAVYCFQGDWNNAALKIESSFLC